jgi:hypothetical protein
MTSDSTEHYTSERRDAVASTPGLKAFSYH